VWNFPFWAQVVFLAVIFVSGPAMLFFMLTKKKFERAIKEGDKNGK
jgi:hypothetical protein